VGGPRSASRKRATTFVVARFLPFLLPQPPLMPGIPTVPPPPPPSHPNASRRWSFRRFRRDCHHHHLPHMQMRAGGGFFSTFDASTTTTTSLACKRKPEVVFFSTFDTSAMTTTSLASKREPEVVFFRFSMHLPPPPPPSHPNARRRWFFRLFRWTRHHHHLPWVQTRDGGGPFNGFNRTATTTTSLASKRETEVVLSAVLTRLPPLPPPSRPNASWRWFFRLFRRTCNHHHLASTLPAATTAMSLLPMNQRQRKWIGGGEGDERKVGNGGRAGWTRGGQGR